MGSLFEAKDKKINSYLLIAGNWQMKRKLKELVDNQENHMTVRPVVHPTTTSKTVNDARHGRTR